MLLTRGPHMVYMGTPYIFYIYMITCGWFGCYLNAVFSANGVIWIQCSLTTLLSQYSVLRQWSYFNTVFSPNGVIWIQFCVPIKFITQVELFTGACWGGESNAGLHIKTISNFHWQRMLETALCSNLGPQTIIL